MTKIEQRISPSDFNRVRETPLRAEVDGYGPDACAALALRSVGLTPRPGVETVFIVDPNLDESDAHLGAQNAQNGRGS